MYNETSIVVVVVVIVVIIVVVCVAVLVGIARNRCIYGTPHGHTGYLCFTCVLKYPMYMTSLLTDQAKKAALRLHPRPPSYTSSSRAL